MNFTLYGDDSGALLKLDPRTKLFIFLASGLMSANTYTYNHLPLLLYGLAMCTVLALCGKPWTGLKSLLFYCVTLYIKEVISRAGGSAPFVTTLVSALATIALYAFPAILSIILIVQTTRISQFLSSLQAMHLPVKAVIPIAMLFRFIPTVQDEWNGIRKAMAFRGISLNIGSILRHPGKTIEYVLVPLLFSTIGVMEELAAAALARGMDIDVKRSSYEDVRLRFADYAVMAVFAAIIIYTIITGHSAGVSS